MAAMQLMMFGCGACKEKFATREEMKQHFSTPFHTYNAERKAKGFTPVDFATYKALEPDEEEQADRSPKFYCKICDKYYKSVQTLTMHLKSNQHLANKQRAIEDGASTVHSTASKFLLGSKYVSSKSKPKKQPGAATGTGGEEGPEEATPTPVLLIKDVPESLTEADVHNMLEPWGAVQRVLLLKKRQQVLVQMPSVGTAMAIIAGCPEGTVAFNGLALPIQYSARESLGQECGWCNQPGHKEENCFLKARSCTYCRQEGHKRKFCPKLPCVCCGSVTHTLATCDHKQHYFGVKGEMRHLETELQQIVEKLQAEEEHEGEEGPKPAEAAAPEEQCSEEARKQRDFLQSCSCYFCDQVGLSAEETARHMLDAHEFRLPMPELIQDLYGLMSYLQRKVRAGLCLWCGEKTKYYKDIKALRQHMNKMGHRNINWTDNVDEYADFYDLPDSTAWVPEADEDGRFELPSGRIIGSRTGRAFHDHHPGEFLMTGKETDLDRRQLLLAYKTQGPLCMNPAKQNLSKSQYHQLVRQDIAIHNHLQRQWLKVGMDHNRAQFRGFTVRVSQ
eukprot:EG_transcript_7380